MSDALRIVRVTVKGFVQGVGYRNWTVREAEALGIEGWVRNRSNGDVEALFKGEAAAVEALCAACRRGPSQAWVERVEVIDAEDSAVFEAAEGQGFRQIATL